MKQSVLLLVIFLTVAQVLAQKTLPKKVRASEIPAAVTEIQIPMEDPFWEYDSSAVEFVTHRNTKVAKGKNGKGYQIFLKNHIFTNGTIEFDVELSGMGFPGINFRVSEDRKNGENFYIRSFGPVNIQTRTTLQYAALIDGVSMWDLSDEYQAGAIIHQQQWNHVKLVISGKQMKAYVNNMQRPALIVPAFESLRSSGTISLSGNVIYANLVIKHNAIEGLSPEEGYTSTYNDTRYLTSWQLSPAKEFAFGREVVMPLPSMYGKLTFSELPDSTTLWSEIKAESRGIINVSRKYGHVENDVRRLAWLKTTLQSDKAQEKILRLGFSDEVWVFLNGQIIYADKNYFGTAGQKVPKGRCTLENTLLKLPLKEGKNEILIGLAHYFYGWGIVARLDDTDGVEITK